MVSLSHAGSWCWLVWSGGDSGSCQIRCVQFVGKRRMRHSSGQEGAHYQMTTGRWCIAACRKPWGYFCISNIPGRRGIIRVELLYYRPTHELFVLASCCHDPLNHVDRAQRNAMAITRLQTPLPCIPAAYPRESCVTQSRHYPSKAESIAAAHLDWLDLRKCQSTSK